MLEDGQVEVKHSLTQKTPEKLLHFSGVFISDEIKAL